MPQVNLAVSGAPATPVDPEIASERKPGSRLRPLVADSDRRTVFICTAVGIVLAVAYLALPLAGTDLSAQVARAHFIKDEGYYPIDFRWYGGTQQFGYSLISTTLMALVGTRGVGASAAVISSFAFAVLLARTNVRRPLLGGILGSAAFIANLVSGRMTFALGVAFGLLALAALTINENRHSRIRGIGAGLFAVLAGAASPVAGLFVAMVGTALFVTGKRRDGALIAVSASVPLVITSVVFGEGGWMTFNSEDAITATLACLGVLLFVPPRYKPLLVGTVMCAIGTVAAYAIHTPVGSNVTRAAIMFSIPVVAATAEISSRWLVVPLVIIGVVQPPLSWGDLSYAGSTTAHRPYYAPLLKELERRQPVGRIEVVPVHDYWDAVYPADTIPIARGWLRQLDNDRNSLFFDGSLSESTYYDWLLDNGVEFVALPSARLSWVGAAEANLIKSGLPYLQLEWENADWRLYRVIDATSIVESPGQLIDTSATGLTLRVDRPGDVLIRIRFQRWLTVDGPAACIDSEGRWSVLRVEKPGTYHISSKLQIRQPSRC